MKYFLLIFSAFIIVAVMLGFFGQLVIARSLPQLSLIMVLALAAERPRSSEAIIFAVSSGIILDAYLSLPIGSWTLALVFAALLMQFLFRVFLSSSVIYVQLLWLSPIFVIGAFVWIWLYTLTLHSFSINFIAVPFNQTIRLAVGSALYGVVLFFPMYWLTEALISFLNRLDARRGKTV